MRKVFLLAITVLLVNACAIQTPKQTSGGPAETLIAQADQFVANGDNSQAIALLDRAVRIEPRNGYAWLHLARLHFASGDLNKAEQFARRAMQVAGGDKALLRESQAMIEKIRLQSRETG